MAIPLGRTLDESATSFPSQVSIFFTTTVLEELVLVQPKEPERPVAGAKGLPSLPPKSPTPPPHPPGVLSSELHFCPLQL